MTYPRLLRNLIPRFRRRWEYCQGAVGAELAAANPQHKLAACPIVSVRIGSNYPVQPRPTDNFVNKFSSGWLKEVSDPASEPYSGVPLAVAWRWHNSAGWRWHNSAGLRWHSHEVRNSKACTLHRWGGGRMNKLMAFTGSSTIHGPHRVKLLIVDLESAIRCGLDLKHATFRW